MAIYRGAGGASDATNDATITQVQTYATQAASSATAAASSATSAASSASGASSSASTATTQATNAASSASAASSSASAAATSASEASGYATDSYDSSLSSASYAAAASGAATTAAGYAANAATSATNSETYYQAALAAKVAAETAETNAELAEAGAIAAQTAAEAAQTAAEDAEVNAAASATAAASDAADAATALAATEAARDSALAAYDSFDDRYLGPKATDPTLDNDGNALVAGALYYDTTTNVMKVYTGSAWVAAYVSASGALLAANNLSDLTSASQARTNLGLGTAATTASTDYATAAQGALADSATQPGDNVSTLTNDAGYITGYTETDPVVGAVSGIVKADGIGNISAAVAGTDYLASFTETDPVFLASEAASITSTDTTNWDTAYGWGNHASVGYQLAATSLTTATNFGGDVSGTYNAIVVADDSHNHVIANVDGLQTALDAKAALNSPTFTGTPAAPTAAVGTNTTQLATTAYVNAEIANDAPTKTGTGASGTWGISITGNAATATSAAAWTTSRTLTIGSTGKSVNGSADVSWTLAEITGTTATTQFGSLGIGTPASGTTGEIRATNNITAYYSSDARLKENVKDVNNALDKVCAIGSKTFEWTDEYIASKGGEDGYFIQKSDFGVIAQDVQAVFPQAVRTREDGTLAVDYEKLATLAFGAIKELVKRVEALEAK